MIYFLTFEEGGQFIKIIRTKSNRPQAIVTLLKGENFIAVFKCGVVYDTFIKRFGYSGWRHCLNGRQKVGRSYYKRLLTCDCPTEYVVGK